MHAVDAGSSYPPPRLVATSRDVRGPRSPTMVASDSLATVRAHSLRRCVAGLVARVALVALVLVLVLVPHRAQADDSASKTSATKKRTSTLGWDRLPGADACVATQPLARAVETRLGRKVFVSPAEADVSVEGRVEKKGAGYTATIVIRDAEGKLLGTRSLEKPDPSCAALTDALVIVIAVMIDPDASLGPVPPVPPPPVPPEAPPAKPPEPRIEKVYVPVLVPTPIEAPRKPALMGDAALSARVAVGVVPDPGVGVSIVGVLVPRRFIGILARASFVVPRPAPVLGAEVSFSHVSGGGGLCPLAHTFGLVFLSGCAEGEIGLLLVRPSGLPRSVNEARFTVAGGASFGASVLLFEPLTVRIGVVAMLPLVRESFEVTLPSGEKSEVFRQLPVTAAGDLGVGVRF